TTPNVGAGVDPWSLAGVDGAAPRSVPCGGPVAGIRTAGLALTTLSSTGLLGDPRFCLRMARQVSLVLVPDPCRAAPRACGSDGRLGVLAIVAGGGSPPE